MPGLGVVDPILGCFQFNQIAAAALDDGPMKKTCGSGGDKHCEGVRSARRLAKDGHAFGVTTEI